MLICKRHREIKSTNKKSFLFARDTIKWIAISTFIYYEFMREACTMNQANF